MTKIWTSMTPFGNLFLQYFAVPMTECHKFVNCYTNLNLGNWKRDLVLFHKFRIFLNFSCIPQVVHKRNAINCRSLALL